MKSTKLFNQIKKEFKLNTPYEFVRPNGFRSMVIIKEFKQDNDGFEFIIADFESDITYNRKYNEVMFCNQLDVLRKYKQAG